MSLAAAWDLQSAVHQALANDAALTAILGPGRVHDVAPADVAYPHVTLGAFAVTDWSTGSGAGLEHRFTLHVWSRHRGRKEVHEICAALYAALHEKALPLAGATLVNLRFERLEIARLPDGAATRGAITFRAVTE